MPDTMLPPNHVAPWMPDTVAPASPGGVAIGDRDALTSISWLKAPGSATGEKEQPPAPEEILHALETLFERTRYYGIAEIAGATGIPANALLEKSRHAKISSVVRHERRAIEGRLWRGDHICEWLANRAGFSLQPPQQLLDRIRRQTAADAEHHQRMDQIRERQAAAEAAEKEAIAQGYRDSVGRHPIFGEWLKFQDAMDKNGNSASQVLTMLG